MATAHSTPGADPSNPTLIIENPLQASIRRLRTQNQTQEALSLLLFDLANPLLSYASVDDFLDQLVPLCPPENLISADILIAPAILKCMRYLLNLRGCSASTVWSQNLALGIIEALYSYEQPVLDDARTRYEAVRNREAQGQGQTRNNQQQLQHPKQQMPYIPNGAKDASDRAHRMSTRWRDTTNVSGAIGSVPGFQEFRQHCQDAIGDYSVPPTERVQLMHHAMTGKAYTFFQEHVAGKCPTVQDAYAVLERHFCSAAAMHSTKLMLDALSISRVMSLKNLDIAAALAHCYGEAARLSSQGPVDFRSDSHRSNVLIKAVRSELWARSTLESNLATPLPFDALYTRLQSSVTYGARRAIFESRC
jgi:hypothetical protein